MSTRALTEADFNLWFNGSKYMQVAYSPNSRQPALDGWNAALEALLSRAATTQAGEPKDHVAWMIELKGHAMPMWYSGEDKPGIPLSIISAFTPDSCAAVWYPNKAACEFALTRLRWNSRVLEKEDLCATEHVWIYAPSQPVAPVVADGWMRDRAKVEELVQHLESIAWRPDSGGDPECMDQAAAMSLDVVRLVLLPMLSPHPAQPQPSGSRTERASRRRGGRCSHGVFPEQ